MSGSEDQSTNNPLSREPYEIFSASGCVFRFCKPLRKKKSEKFAFLFEFISGIFLYLFTVSSKDPAKSWVYLFTPSKHSLYKEPIQILANTFILSLFLWGPNQHLSQSSASSHLGQRQAFKRICGWYGKQSKVICNIFSSYMKSHPLESHISPAHINPNSW